MSKSERDDDGRRGTPGALFTDLYELTMLQSYWLEKMHDTAIFSLYYRTRPPNRNYLVASGLGFALDYLEALRFTADDLAYLATLGQFRDEFLEWLEDFRFTGNVRAVPEGTPVFPEEPVLEVEAPLPQAQLVETSLINLINFSTLIASKAARIVRAAAGRPVFDFGSRRAHGVDAGLKAARASCLAGCAATSNVLAGKLYGLPVAGTMAHSYVAAHIDEAHAFRRFVELYPNTVLLVDTYDSLTAVDTVIRLAKEDDSFRVRAIRLDSGDLVTQSREARVRLDRAGLSQMKIFASGGLDEHSIERLVASGAPIDGFGVGTSLVTSSDAAQMDFSYKLSAYGGIGRLKLSTGKRHLPGPKQVFRSYLNGHLARDVLGTVDDDVPGEPLLSPVMTNGVAHAHARPPLEAIRDRVKRSLARLPDRLHALGPADPPFDAEVSPRLQAEADRIREMFVH